METGGNSDWQQQGQAQKGASYNHKQTATGQAHNRGQATARERQQPGIGNNKGGNIRRKTTTDVMHQ